MGLKFYDALLQVPVFYVIYTICGVVAGGVYFQEFKSFDVEKAAGFFSGILCIFVGVAFLAGRLKSGQPHQDEDVALEDMQANNGEEKGKLQHFLLNIVYNMLHVYISREGVVVNQRKRIGKDRRGARA
jgi:putative Mn2+ efflux pump MntP